MNKLVVITGQTATGKTKLALECAEKYNGELVNCDSRQIYKYLDIITGKDKQLLAKVKVWLYDFVKPDEYFSSFDFVKLTVPIIKKILSEGKTPIIVGGTYMYIKHLLYKVETDNIPPDWRLRKELANKSVSELQNILKDINVQSFNRLNNSEKNNPQRLIRKIEIASFRHSGKSRRNVGTHPESDSGVASLPRMTIGEKLKIKNLDLDFIGLKFKNKNNLLKAIEQRVEKRLKQGAPEEVKNLLKMGYSEKDPGLKTLGCQHILAHLRGVLTWQEAVDQWTVKELQYAKRQYTFMKKDENIRWKII